MRVTESAQQAIVANARQDENGVISYSSVGWRSYPRSIAVNQSGESTFLVPARFRSLNNIIWGVRNPRSSNFAGQDPSNTYTVASSWYSRVGGISYPSISPHMVLLVELLLKIKLLRIVRNLIVVYLMNLLMIVLVL